MHREISEAVLNCLEIHGADYGDVRVVKSAGEKITVSGDEAEEIRRDESLGFGVRVLKDGAWGFAASDVMNPEKAHETAKKALAVAKAGVRALPQNERYVPPEAVSDHFITPFKKDPLKISLETKLELLSAAATLMLKNRNVKIARGFCDISRTEKIFRSLTGSDINQTIITCGGGILAYAVGADDAQMRSYPNSFRGNFSTAGWEFVEGLDLPGNAGWVAEEATELLKAPPCPADDEATLIIAPDQLALQIHESIGHPIELDRVFGQEISLAGSSFLEPKMLNEFQYAAPCVTVVADAAAPGGLGSFGYDDEGVPAQRFPIIERGVFRNFLTSCGTAPQLPGDHNSNGTARAAGWNHIPLIRMTNINLEPGDANFEELLADTKKGFLIETNKSWSIDDKRLNFQFGAEVAREIKNGKPGKIYKNPVYSGVTPVFWKSCDAVCDARWFEFYGTPNCGKGEPMQIMNVGHGTPPARFRKVALGHAR